MPSKKPMKKTFRSSKPSTFKPAKSGIPLLNSPKPQVSIEVLIYILLACALIVSGLLAVPNYNILLQPGNLFTENEIPVLPTSNFFTHLPSTLLIGLGFLGLVVSWRFVPEVSADKWDVSPWVSRLFFWIFIGVGTYLRLENPRWPVGNFWDDNYYVISDIRNIIDFHLNYLLFPFGWREPFYPYLSAFIWILFPSLTGEVLVLVSSTVIDMVSVWLFYLIGKEIGGRRMGLILMALGAICKTMIMMTRFEYGTDTCVLGSALAILFFLRVLKKPDVLHFVELGLALGFGGYTYVPFRPWMPVMLGVAWLWIYSDPKERKINFSRFAIGPLALMVCALVFLYENSLYPNKNLFKFIIHPYVIGVLLLVVIYEYFKSFKEERNQGYSKLFGWTTGAFVTELVMLPLYLHPDYSAHVSSISVFSPLMTAPGQGWQKLWDNVVFTFLLLFKQVNNVSRLPALGDSLYEFLVSACALLGLSYFVSRPRWIQTYIVVLFIVSLVPGVLSNGPHSFRYASCDLPLLLVGAWGVNRLWLVVRQVNAKFVFNFIFVILILLVWGWELGENHKLTWEWLNQQACTSKLWSRTEKELPDHRVYLVDYDKPQFYTPAQDILADGEQLYVMDPERNPIDLIPGEPRKDLAILVDGYDKTDQKKIETEFPDVKWSKEWNFLDPPGPGKVPYLWYTQIPFSEIPQNSHDLFYVQYVSPWSWLRRCYGHYGLGRGLIVYEDRVTLWNNHLPPHNRIDWNNSMRISGNWNIRVTGDYLFRVTTANITWFFVDGKKIINVPPGNNIVNEVYKIHLKAGIHHVEMVTAFNWEHQVPSFFVTPPNSKSQIPFDVYAATCAGNSETGPETSGQ